MGPGAPLGGMGHCPGAQGHRTWALGQAPLLGILNMGPAPWLGVRSLSPGPRLGGRNIGPGPRAWLGGRIMRLGFCGFRTMDPGPGPQALGQRTRALAQTQAHGPRTLGPGTGRALIMGLGPRALGSH